MSTLRSSNRKLDFYQIKLGTCEILVPHFHRILNGKLFYGTLYYVCDSR